MCLQTRVTLGQPNYQLQIHLTRSVHKILMRMVLSDRYRITQEKSQYHGVEM